MNLEEAREHIVVATSIIALGHRLGLTVVAEGVETHEQAAFLGAESCDVLQGFLFSRPIPSEECSRIMTTGTSAYTKLLEDAAARLAERMSSGGFGQNEVARALKRGPCAAVRPRDTSCTSCRSRTGTGRCGRPSRRPLLRRRRGALRGRRAPAPGRATSGAAVRRRTP